MYVVQFPGAFVECFNTNLSAKKLYSQIAFEDMQSWSSRTLQIITHHNKSCSWMAPANLDVLINGKSRLNGRMGQDHGCQWKKSRNSNPVELAEYAVSKHSLGGSRYIKAKQMNYQQSQISLLEAHTQIWGRTTTLCQGSIGHWLQNGDQLVAKCNRKGNEKR